MDIGIVITVVVIQGRAMWNSAFSTSYERSFRFDSTFGNAFEQKITEGKREL